MTAVIFYIYIWQSSVATLLGCDDIFTNFFTANFSQSAAVKEFLKSVNIWQSYGQKLAGTFSYGPRCS